ncbi:MAG: class I SAM-dependent DNA methyltransferase, partial [Betaproteobacteria bacterium]|nr:class I SAM-dependent DNA methyltransferase [Betaproteobacteria bacterium]
GPLFLDELKARLHEARAQGGSKAKLQALLARLRRLNLLDPACGCGNFLVIAYREIRRLELEAVEALQAIDRRNRDVSYTLDAKQFEYIQCDVHQFHGIEIEPSAAHIATVALWLTDHQENLRASRVLGGNFNRLPLVRRANIVCANALTVDWGSVLLPELCDYVVGNPPFVGKKEQNAEQKTVFGPVMSGLHGSGVLDFVAAWYVKAARYLADAAARMGQTPGAHKPAAPKSRPASAPYAPQRQPAVSVRTRCAFVSTNSITQGEQVGVLWGWMLAQGMKIQFAHRTFQWSNDAKGVAAVHCVIIGFGTDDVPGKVIFDYPDLKGEPVALAARNINPYLVDAADVVLQRRTNPVCAVPSLVEGITPLDNGILAFTPDEANAFLAKEPTAAKWMRPWLTGNYFINGTLSYCLWLADSTPMELRKMPQVMALIADVKAFRLSSKSSQKFADRPWLFRETSIPDRFILIPKTSSERREYFPLGFVERVVPTNSALYLADADV